MNNADFQLRGVGDTRLAVYASSSQPVWLWSLDGTRVLWANPMGARLLGARNAAELFTKTFGAADSYRRQVAQLGERLAPGGSVRLERLRGFGAALGSLMTCACSLLDFADGGSGILVVAAEPVGGRGMPLVERLQNLVEGIDTPIAAFARDGLFVGASDAARALLGFRNLSDAGLDAARADALKDGRVETPIGFGRMVLQRVGSGADIGLVALIAPGEMPVDRREKEPETLALKPASTVDVPDAVPDAGAIDDVVEVDPALMPTDLIAHAAEVDKAIEIEATSEPVTAESGTAESETAETDTAASLPADLEDAIAHPSAEIPSAEIPDALTEPPHMPAHNFASPPAEPTLGEPADFPRDAPLRFVWQIDSNGRFTINSDAFMYLIGPYASTALGRTWNDIASESGLDPDGRVATALATRQTWGGMMLPWPADGGLRLPVELSGLPTFDRDGQFCGYRGFGICRDLASMNRLAEQRRERAAAEAPHDEPPHDPPPRGLSADVAQAGPVGDNLDDPIALATEPSPLPTPTTEPDTSVQPPENVVHFRSGEARSPALTPVENSAFNELARQLSARLEAETGLIAGPNEAAPAPTEAQFGDSDVDMVTAPGATDDEAITAPSVAPADTPATAWLTTPPAPPRGEMARDRTLLDLMPVGVLIYRLDRLLFANPAFLARMNYPTLNALEEAGGLDALYVEPDVSAKVSTSDGGTAVTISAGENSSDTSADALFHIATEARLHTIAWDGEPAHALIFSVPEAPAAIAPVAATESPVPAPDLTPPPSGHIDAEDLAAILDTTAEGVLLFDAEGNIHSCNRSAEALFGYDGNMLTQRNLTDLFASESRRVVEDYLASIRTAGTASLLDHGREALGQVRAGGLVPLSMILGRTRADGHNFFAVFRDLTQTKKTESELLNARRQADRAATAKADVLTRISHEVRTPLNAIIGFSEVMIDQRFGALGNERYGEYMRDIRASGERVIAIVNDLLDLSRIETGKLDLAFSSQNLNEMVEQCVAVMQPQANRGRIIIRTSLAHLLPTIVADARALRQITLNLIGSSIHLANAGGQVIVSTALSDDGEVVLRVRDTGHRLNDSELAATMEPFRNAAPTDQSSDSSGVSLSLTKALVEANNARFQIKTAPSSGTLIEVTFTNAMAKA